MKRREFMKSVVLGSVSAGLLGSIFHATRAFALELIDISGKRKDAANTAALKTATALNYVENLEAALKQKKIKKEDRKVGEKTVKASEQTCDTCQFYKSTKEGAGTCTLIPGVLVHAKGSCNSWVPKA